MCVLEPRNWPTGIADELDAFGIAEVKVLAEHFKDYELMDDFDLREALAEWPRIKHEAPKLAFLKFSFRKFWTHMSVFFRDEARYPHLLKLVAVVLLVIMDTAINVRHFLYESDSHGTQESPEGQMQSSDLLNGHSVL